MVNLAETEAYLHLPIWQELAQGRICRNLYPTCKPTRLVELEEFANLAADHMSNSTTSPETYSNLRQLAMNQLRQLFNLEFKLRCHLCGTAHYQDEVTAPER
ncbi:hypothetical protein PYW08_007101 [Mythimna loreyi]|uniref:Uncharacterized protein n=1 Tax=Mythimna loreyi TaxID=667449 RepID=A0ACC2RBV8_9NEOP|nr:hypothetical protein PYW08_007101 [Mythimna loreyi]